MFNKVVVKKRFIPSILTLFVAFLFLITELYASSIVKFHNPLEACQAAQSTLADGDLIFLEMNDFIFRRVERATQSWTSHVGVAFKEGSEWVVAESTVPISKKTKLCDFLQDSKNYHFQISRYRKQLSESQLEAMRKYAFEHFDEKYDYGFDLHSKRPFCSKFTYLAYQAAGIEIGKVQSFKEMLSQNPSEPLLFWRVWFLGFIPWSQETVSPASELNDPGFDSVLEGKI